MTHLHRIVAAVLALVLAVGCGGGDGNPGVAKEAPVANAGVAQNVIAGVLVTLNGGSSSDANGDPLSYTWTLTSKPAGSKAVLIGATSVAPTFTADVEGTYLASLTVSDGKVSSTTSTVTVTATTVNSAPVANAGVAQNLTAGTLVTLDGSASRDANADPLTYSWTLTSRPAGSAAALSGATSAVPTFTADVAGIYVASLVVNDGKISSTASSVVITATVKPISVLAVGDIAQCGSRPAADSAAAKTAAIVAQQASDTPLLLLGDLVYDSGTLAEYRNCYEPTYGAFMARSFPAPGNHDYGVPEGDDYYTYFGTRAGPDKRGYYSFDVGSWHVVSLNSNIDMAKGSEQEVWLHADLMANRSKKCTLAYWHHPRFSSSTVHGNDPRSSDIWRLLFEFSADVVLVGHDHVYERFAPQDPDANADPIKGIRQFVIGTGGAALYQFGAPEPNSEVRGAGSFGVARFLLADGKYSWEFLPATGSTFTDSGESRCVE